MSNFEPSSDSFAWTLAYLSHPTSVPPQMTGRDEWAANMGFLGGCVRGKELPLVLELLEGLLERRVLSEREVGREGEELAAVILEGDRLHVREVRVVKPAHTARENRSSPRRSAVRRLFASAHGAARGRAGRHGSAHLSHSFVQLRPPAMPMPFLPSARAIADGVVYLEAFFGP